MHEIYSEFLGFHELYHLAVGSLLQSIQIPQEDQLITPTANRVSIRLLDETL